MSLCLAAVNRVVETPIGAAASWGSAFDEHALNLARETMATVVTQDRSLARHVARDLALAFESCGGLVNLTIALQGLGMTNEPSITTGDAASRAGGYALAVARVIQARSQDREGVPSDVSLYQQLFEDRSERGYERALDVGAWAATASARMYTAGHLGEIPLFSPHHAFVGTMDGIGWYPNPVNPGDTSMGDASIERWWNGDDWTDRARVREGRGWREASVSLLTAPNN